MVVITDQTIDGYDLVSQYVKSLPQAKFGATCVFIGTMRDFNENDDVVSMELEHYPEMTQRTLEDMASGIASKYDLIDIYVAHRVGTILPNDDIVVVACWSAHRKNAFEACRYMMEELKSKAPFWKKETTSKGTRWVEHNTAGF